jgi:hypothetical protein
MLKLNYVKQSYCSFDSSCMYKIYYADYSRINERINYDRCSVEHDEIAIFQCPQLLSLLTVYSHYMLSLSWREKQLVTLKYGYPIVPCTTPHAYFFINSTEEVDHYFIAFLIGVQFLFRVTNSRAKV